MLYWNKEKSQVMFERLGEQYSELTNNLDFGVIVHQSRNIVNTILGNLIFFLISLVAIFLFLSDILRKNICKFS